MTSDSETQIGDDTALQDALEREAATREILQVISRSRDDEKPVLECIVRNAGHLCNAPDVGLHLVNEARTHCRLTCVWGPDLGVFPVGMEFDLSEPLLMAKAIHEARTLQIADLADAPDYPYPWVVRKLEEEGSGPSSASLSSRMASPLGAST